MRLFLQEIAPKGLCLSQYYQLSLYQNMGYTVFRIPSYRGGALIAV